MEYRVLGYGGVRVSPLCLGTMNFGQPTPEDEASRMINLALDAGINFIDTANGYAQGESERIIGRSLANGKRMKVILATKVHFPQSDDPNDRGNSRHHIFAAIENSLRRLRTEWIDLYQIHRPEMSTPQEETLRALDDLIRQGKVRHIGCSTFPSWLIMEALAISERYRLARFVTEQPPYNLLDRRVENEVVPLALRYRLGLLPWSPLAMGILAGRYKDAESLPEDSRAIRFGPSSVQRISKQAIECAKRIAEIAHRRNLSSAQLALLWLKDQPAVTAPILGPRTEAHLLEALSVLEMTMTADLAAELDNVVAPGSAVADFHNTSGWMKMKLND